MLNSVFQNSFKSRNRFEPLAKYSCPAEDDSQNHCHNSCSNASQSQKQQLYFLIPWLFCVLTDKAIARSCFTDYFLGIKGPEYFWIVYNAYEVEREMFAS